jgi:hypothetical protein
MSADRCFGSPQTVGRLGDAAEQTTSELDRLLGTLNAGVRGLLPGAWRGSAATAFGQHWQGMSGAGGQAGQMAGVWSGTMRTLSGELGAAKLRFEQAQAQATTQGLVILPTLEVVPCNADDPNAWRAAAQVQREVNAAREMAEAARATARQANEAVAAGLDRVVSVLAQLVGIGRAGPSLSIVRGVIRGALSRLLPSRPTAPPALPAPTASAPTGPAAAPAGPTDKALAGTRMHSDIQRTLQPHEGQRFGRLTLLGNNRTMGGTRRPDEVYVDHEAKEIIVVDTYTGPTEPLAHNQKGWSYQNEPEIQALIQQGYTYQYVPAMAHPSLVQ